MREQDLLSDAVVFDDEASAVEVGFIDEPVRCDRTEQAGEHAGRPAESDLSNLMTLYLRDVRRFQRLTGEEEARLLALMDDGRADAREQLICHHLGLVIAMARTFNNRGLELLDLIEEGNLGMLVALQRFESERGLRFSTYAAWWIRYYLQTAIATQVPIVRPPLRAQQRARRRAWQEWCDSHDVATPADARRPQSSANGTALVARVSMDDADVDAWFAQAGLHHPDALHEVAERHDTPVLAQLLRRLVARLPARQRDIIVARFGLDGSDECTLQQLSAERGVSRERIRQIEAAALQALRDELMGEGVTRDAALE